MNKKLLQPEIREFILSHLSEDLNQLSLKYREFAGVPFIEIAAQIKAIIKAQKKWGPWWNSDLYMPPPSSIEQSSSYACASFKSKWISSSGVKGIVDLTGGSGIDSRAFADDFQETVYIEKSESLYSIFKYNQKFWGIDSKTVHTDCLDWLVKNENTDFAYYIDPLRRSKDRRYWHLDDSEPDLHKVISEIEKRGAALYIKLSPMMDISFLINEFPGLTEVLVIGVKNEVKEILLKNSATSQKEELSIRCVELTKDAEILHDFSFQPNQEDGAKSIFGSPDRYIYDPLSIILKAGAFKTMVDQFSIKKLSKNAHLYTSDDLITNFPGRIFQLEEVLSYNKKAVQKAMDNEMKASVFTRDFPSKPDEIKKKLGLKSSDDRFIIGTTLSDKKKVLLLTKRIK